MHESFPHSVKETDENMMNSLFFSYTFTVTITEYSKSSGSYYYPNILGSTAAISVPLEGKIKIW